MSGDLHKAVEAAATAAGTTSAGWMRDLAAEILGVDVAPPRRSAPRPKVRPLPSRQAALRQAVASLGALGSALDAHGADPTLVAEIRQAVRAVVDRVRRS